MTEVIINDDIGDLDIQEDCRSPTCTKSAQEELDRLTEEFLNKGGEVEEVEPGKRTIKYDKLGLRNDITPPKWFR